MKFLLKFSLIFVFFGLFSINANSEINDQQKLYNIQKIWAPLNFSKEDTEGVIINLKILSEESEKLAIDNPDNIDFLIWDAIIKSTLANKMGGLKALSLVKESKIKLERAIQHNPQALGGSALASLGVLYHKVPTWPVSFGNHKKAEKFLKQALAINPDGLDVNFFYADFLVDKGKVDEAIIYLNKALEAPVIQGRPFADQARREQAKALLENVTS